MVTKIPHDPNLASFTSEEFGNVEVLAGDTPAIVTRARPVGQNTSLKKWAVVGIGALGVLSMATAGAVAGVKATQNLTFSGVAIANETVTINARVYTFKAAPALANEVLVGVTAAACAANLIAAINADPAQSGVAFGAGTAVHADVVAQQGATTSIVRIVAKTIGAAANALATTETLTNGAWGAATLAGGADSIGVVPEGVLTTDVTTGAGVDTQAHIAIAGCFNPDALVWDQSFNSDSVKLAAFDLAALPTHIVLKKPQYPTSFA